MNAEEIIRHLGLVPLPLEGGFFRETYRSPGSIPPSPAGHDPGRNRSLSTAIYYLLTPDTFSALHRLPGDEIYHFYVGDPVELLVLHPDGSGETVTLGGDLLGGMSVQHVVPGGSWQGSRLAAGGAYALLGTTMAPGFDPGDLKLGSSEALLSRYPAFGREIRRLLAEESAG